MRTPTCPPAPAASRGAPRRLTAFVIAFVVAVLGTMVAASPAQAASQGVGFGSWAPVSAYGWHGSMVIDGVHTYCILPGAPAPTGPSTDRGISTTAAGLSAQQLTGINLLVTKYGQTDDPVQAASVGWAVKALANWSETLHHFGYRGDSLAGAIHWTFSALAPAHDEAIQRLAVAYYDEARSASAGVGTASGRVEFTTDAADPRLGTVRVVATTDAATMEAAIGALTLVDATFVDTASSTRADAVPGAAYAIETSPPTPGRPYSVSGSGRFSLTAPAAAVRHFTTPGGQDTAGPAGALAFDVSGADAAPRVPLFAPTITTQVAAKYVGGGPFVDDVSFGGSVEDWPRTQQGAFHSVVATAAVYRTDSQPVLTDGAVPEDAVQAGSLGLTTDPATGPAGPYRVRSEWDLAEPGYYTAVWTVRYDDQNGDVTPSLAAGYTWTEPFGEPSQITMRADVSTLAEPSITTGHTMSDQIIVSGPVPPGGLTLTSSVYRAEDGVEPSETCTDHAHVWTSDPHTLLTAGAHVVTAPAIDEPGTYYWQERALDAAGELVHVGECGLPQETTRVVVATTSPSPTPDIQAPSALAATGGVEPSLRTYAVAAIALLTAGGTLSGLARRRRRRGRTRAA